MEQRITATGQALKKVSAHKMMEFLHERVVAGDSKPPAMTIWWTWKR